MLQSGSKILYHHVDLGKIIVTHYIERESCGILLEILHLDFYVWSFYAFCCYPIFDPCFLYIFKKIPKIDKNKENPKKYVF